MLIDFTKMQGCGNDFILVADWSGQLDLSSDQVDRLCDRHFGIGADGLILVRPASVPEALAFMHYRNADGSLAEMCGNGVRCFAKYLVDNGHAPADSQLLVVETLAGLKPIAYTLGADGKLQTAAVDMGEPRFTPALIPTTLAASGQIELRGDVSGQVTLTTTAVLDTPLAVGEGLQLFTLVNIGNPHAVCFLDDADAALLDCSDSEFAALAQPLALSPLFPEGVNLEFARVLTPGDPATPASIRMRVWERGCGETLACGTGACACAVAAAVTERAGRLSRLHLRGGELAVEWRPDNQVWLSGPAETVFSGQVEL